MVFEGWACFTTTTTTSFDLENLGVFLLFIIESFLLSVLLISGHVVVLIEFYHPNR